MPLDIGNLLQKYLNPSSAPSAERHVRQGYAVKRSAARRRPRLPWRSTANRTARKPIVLDVETEASGGAGAASRIFALSRLRTRQ